MKPFDIDLARQGHPVCYRDGTEPDDIHICPEWVDLEEQVTTRIGKQQYRHMDNGRYLLAEDTKFDLFMKTETKSQWANISVHNGAAVLLGMYGSRSEALAALPTGSRVITVEIGLPE